MNRDIAIVGMSVRAPGADTLEQYWDNIVNKKEAVKIDGIKKDTKKRNNQYEPVYSRGHVSNLDKFDNDLFKISDAEARVMSIVYKKVIEMTWELLECAGLRPGTGTIPCSVYLANEGEQYKDNKECSPSHNFEKYITNGCEFITTRLSYLFNLTGESVDIMSACSSSLVAVVLACQSLILGNSDYAIAGGVNLYIPQDSCYYFQEGMIYSKSGHCSPFSAGSDGTVESNGMGLVLLKRLEDAVRDGDYIYSVIKSSAINNDGGNKIGYAAPSVTGQKEVIIKAINKGNIPKNDIVYIETHGTATAIGDAIEFQALDSVFADSDRKDKCYLGSVKANIGHTIRAAGILSLVKATMICNTGIMPGMCNFRELSPLIKGKTTCLCVNKDTIQLDADISEKYVGVSSFGIGGTNAHVILSGYKNKTSEVDSKNTYEIVISARSLQALNLYKDRLKNHCLEHVDVNIEDFARTLNCHRTEFEYKATITFKNYGDLVEVLSKNISLNENAEVNKDKRAGCIIPLPVAPFETEVEHMESKDNCTKQRPDFEQLGEMCTKLIGILGTYISVNNISTKTDIYEFGMSSLLLLNFVSDCEDAFDIEIDLDDISELQTFGEIYDFLQEQLV